MKIFDKDGSNLWGREALSLLLGMLLLTGLVGCGGDTSAIKERDYGGGRECVLSRRASLGG